MSCSQFRVLTNMYLKNVMEKAGLPVQVRDELEQLLDDDKDMADLYLTRKLAQWQHIESPSASFREDGPYNSFEHMKSSHYNGATSMAASISFENEDVEELEMLLEAYFMQLDGTLNKLTMVRFRNFFTCSLRKDFGSRISYL